MKRIKKVFLLLIIFLFSGCSLTYDLIIDPDLSVTEEISATEDEYVLWTNTGMKTDKAVPHLYEIFKRDGVDSYLSTKTLKNDVIVNTSLSHKNLESYRDNFTSDVIKEVNVKKNGNLITLIYNQQEELSDKANSLIYDDITINITLPFKVTEHNADKVTRNTYTWNIKKNEELKNIKITFDKSKQDGSRELSVGFFKINVKYSVLLLVGIVLVILSIVVVVFINNKKNNVV